MEGQPNQPIDLQTKRKAYGLRGFNFGVCVNQIHWEVDAKMEVSVQETDLYEIPVMDKGEGDRDGEDLQTEMWVWFPTTKEGREVWAEESQTATQF